VWCFVKAQGQLYLYFLKFNKYIAFGVDVLVYSSVIRVQTYRDVTGLIL